MTATSDEAEPDVATASSVDQHASRSSLAVLSASLRPPYHPMVFLLTAAVAAGVVVWKLNSEGAVLLLFRALRENLPLTLPVLSACLSIMLNIREILANRDGWLKLSLPLSLGLVSFSIWYVVAAQGNSDRFIRISPEKVLDREYSVLLLLMAFIWAAFVALARVLAQGSEPDKRGWFWHVGQIGLLAVSIVGLLVPFFLFESKEAVEQRLRRSLDEASFSVTVPFRDASLNQQITQCEVFRDVPARTATEAAEIATNRFKESPRAVQQYAKTRDGDPPRRVELLEAWIVAERQPRPPD